jgi:outer membrane receptor protein involved in Fe transport
MRVKFWQIGLALAVGGLLLPLAAQAQDGKVCGTINDVGGDPLPGVTVIVLGTGCVEITDIDGKYCCSVPAGDQEAVATLEGFKPASGEVSVTAGGTATADFTLELDLLNMDSIIVTGTTNPLSKLESSVAITTMDAEEIALKAPLNTAQMLEVIPGFWAESSGGEGGNNLFARGIPQDGSFRYVAMHEDGLPVYESPELAFTNVDLLFRIDDTVAVMEAVRGGSASIFASNAPGGIVNFVTKRGGEVAEGTVKITLGDYDLFRTDVNYGGPLGEEWRFNVGGFYRFDKGIRDPDFPANRGGQARFSLTRLLENGFVNFNAKYMNERNIFYLPIPLQNPNSPAGVSSFDPNYGTMTSNDMARFKIPTPPFGDVQEYNLKDGMHPQLFQLGGEVDLDLGGGWSISDRFRYMNADVQFNAIFSLSNPFDATLYALDYLGTMGADGVQYVYTNFPDATFVPGSANGNGLVAEVGWWFVDKPLDNFVNDLRITKTTDNMNVTAGLYFSDYSANEFWTFNTVLAEVRDAPRLLDLQLLDAGGDVIGQVTGNGVVSWGDLYVNASHNGWLTALYVNDEWQVNDKLRLDLGFRFEQAEFSGVSEQAEDFDLSDALADAGAEVPILADDSISWGTGQYTPYSYDFDETAWSVGLNYSLSAEMALFARVADAFRMPDFEQWTFNPTVKGDVEDVFQMEAGVKVSKPKLGVFVSLFQSQFDNVRFEDEQIDPATGQLTRFVRFADTETIGIEAEVILAPAPGWQLAFTGTFQQPEFENYDFNVFNPATGMVEPVNFSGNQVRRIPETILNFRPSYTTGMWRFFASWFQGDDRFVDDANNVVLPGYDKIDAGVSYDFPSVTLQLTGTNLTNEIGLTEGNPRVGQIVGVSQDIFMARPILGRAWRLSASYKF